MTQAITPRHFKRLLSRLATRAARPLEQLSDRIHAGGDATARQNGWEITRTSGRLGFGARMYHDPLFAQRARGNDSFGPEVGKRTASATDRPSAGGPATASQPHYARDRGEGTHV
jgi:hypothetical protein